MPLTTSKKINISIDHTINNIAIKWLYIYGVKISTTIWSEQKPPPPIFYCTYKIFNFKPNADLLHIMLPKHLHII